jgi:hypothetical protein
MIQRVQSIYLLLAIICLLVPIFSPLYLVTAFTEQDLIEVTFGSQGLQGFGVEGGDFPIYLLYTSLIGLCIIAIALFKRRPRQLLVMRITLILTILVAFSMMLFYYLAESFVATALEDFVGVGAEVKMSMGLGLYFLIAAVPFLVLAIRGVKNDEKLLKSIDRIR